MTTTADPGPTRATADPTTPRTTHTVFNQAPPRRDINEFTLNRALVDALAHYAPNAATDDLERIGALVGSADFINDARLANVHGPVLHTHDDWGNRIDEIEFHPAYHRIIGDALDAEAHSYAWTHPGPGANVERAVRFMLFSQIEPGHACPVSMTHAVVPSLRADSALAEFWEPRATASGYDPRRIDPATKSAVTFGMAMTEKQGGSDIRANTTYAVSSGDHHLITGHKWFCSAPQSDAFLVIAQLDEGPSCFVVPRVLPGGELNTVRIQRLKDKLGNRSNASLRNRVRRHRRMAARRGRQGRAHDHRDGGSDPARLRARVGRGHAPMRRRGGLARSRTRGLRCHAHRPAAHARRHRRPPARSRSGDLHGAAPGRRRTTMTAPRRLTSADWRRPSANTGSANADPNMPMSLSSASAATATPSPSRWPAATGNSR